MYIQVQEAIIKAIQIVQFKGYSCGEVIIIDKWFMDLCSCLCDFNFELEFLV
jgi:hypothetical protein